MKTNQHNTLIAILFAFILFMQNINNVVIVFDFVINQDFIAKTLCIQKEEQKGCNGKCQLEKRLNLDVNDSSKKDPINTTFNNRIEYVFIQPINEINLHTHKEYTNKNISDFHNYNTLKRSDEIDSPPPVFS